MKLNHIGVAVRDILQASQDYRKLGFCVSEPEPQPEHGVTVAFVELENTTIELLEPLGEKSPITGFLEKRGPGVHHLAIGVEDIRACMHKLKEEGIPLLQEEPKVGAHDHLVAFLHPRATSSSVLLELCETRKF